MPWWSDPVPMELAPWYEDVIADRLQLWSSRSYYSTSSLKELARELDVILAQLDTIGVRFTGPLGGSVGLVARAKSADGRDIVVKIAPRSFSEPEAAVFAAGSATTPVLIDSGATSGDVGWLVMEWAGTPPPFGMCRLDLLLDTAERFVELVRRVQILGKPAPHRHEAARAQARVVQMLDGTVPDFNCQQFTDHLGFSQMERSKVLVELDRVVSVPPDDPVEGSLIHGDIHEGNLLLDDAGRLRVIDPKLVSGDLCIETAYMAVMLRDEHGQRLGRLEPALAQIAARPWGEPERAARWSRWFAARHAISWWYNSSGTVEETLRAVTYALG
jgi:hypothetical protein